MRRSITLAATLVLTLIPAISAAAASAGDKAAIETMERGLAAAQTPDQVARYYSDDAVLYDTIAPGVFEGGKAIQEDIAKQFVGIKSAKVDIKSMTVGVEGNLGYAYSIQRASIVKSDGTAFAASFRQTDIWRKSADGEWRIIHQQISYPVDPATNKAVM